MIVLCRFYKINYLHLHFTDDQAFTFPATAIPELAGKTRQYTLAELRDLENFAHDRGVIILPEIDLPGHSACLVNAVPERFANDPQADNVLCPGRENVYEILDQVIAEMVDVFPSSPYIHIGADEVVSGCWESCSRCREYMQKNEIPNKEELYRHFLVRMNDLVKKHGKKTMVWEGFAKDGQIKIPNDITVMVFESLYNIAPDLIAGGYPIVNATWQPLYIVPWKHWSAEEIYKWHPLRWESWVTWSRAYQNPIIIEPTPLFQGCQLCSWEQADGQEWPTTRDRLPAMSERAWNPNAEKSFEDFSHRFQTNDARLQLLLP